jgi:hypothetical protein
VIFDRVPSTALGEAVSSVGMACSAARAVIAKGAGMDCLPSTSLREKPKLSLPTALSPPLGTSTPLRERETRYQNCVQDTISGLLREGLRCAVCYQLRAVRLCALIM